MKFTYSSGQRPLDGFTLKRGIGRGGFGEVYFDISDGGITVHRTEDLTEVTRQPLPGYGPDDYYWWW